MSHRKIQRSHILFKKNFKTNLRHFVADQKIKFDQENNNKAPK